MKETNKINIKGVNYPIRLTIGAMVQYKRATGEDFTRFKGDDMEQLAQIIFFATRSTCKADGIGFPYDSYEEIMDYIDMASATEMLGLGAAQPAHEGEGEKN